MYDLYPGIACVENRFSHRTCGFFQHCVVADKVSMRISFPRLESRKCTKWTMRSVLANMWDWLISSGSPIVKSSIPSLIREIRQKIDSDFRLWIWGFPIVKSSIHYHYRPNKRSLKTPDRQLRASPSSSHQCVTSRDPTKVLWNHK